jgi:hypothetical protein
VVATILFNLAEKHSKDSLETIGVLHALEIKSLDRLTVSLHLEQFNVVRIAGAVTGIKLYGCCIII